jgi:SAM-dependent methyltransferase
MTRLRQWLAHPLTRGLDLDDPRTTQLRRRIIAEKPFLRALYREWYSHIAQALPDGEEPVLELGSGAGFLEDYVPGLITSEIFYCDRLSAVLDGHCLPFADASLRAIVMTDVLHHLSAARRFFREAARCVRSGGAVIMIEPWSTPWSRFIYTRLHHEPFQTDVKEWEFPSSGPLSGANGALPWIIFERDRTQFEREFPEWSIQDIELLTPFRYLLSGGVSMRSLMPAWSFGVWRLLERGLSPWLPQLAMFAQITLRRGA